MRQVEFEGQKHNITISASSYCKMLDQFRVQDDAHNERIREAKENIQKINSLLDKFKNSNKSKFSKGRIAQKIRKLEDRNRYLQIRVAGYENLILYIAAFYMLQPVNGTNKYRKWWHKLCFKKVGYHKFLKYADREDLNKISDEIMSIVYGKTKEDYIKDKKKAERKIKKENSAKIKKKIQNIQLAMQ